MKSILIIILINAVVYGVFKYVVPFVKKEAGKLEGEVKEEKQEIDNAISDVKKDLGK